MITDSLEPVFISQPIHGDEPSVGGGVGVTAASDGADILDLRADPLLSSDSVHCYSVLAGEAEVPNPQSTIPSKMFLIKLPVRIASVAPVVHRCTQNCDWSLRSRHECVRCNSQEDNSHYGLKKSS